LRLTQWVQAELKALGELNRRCSPRLHKLLRDNHNIRLWADREGPPGQRGTAIYAAYDPWNTCLRVVPGSFRYFDAAQKQAIINERESLRLSLALVECCHNLRERYQGHFSYFYESPEVSSFLNCRSDGDTLRDRELADGACADVLYGLVPWPVQPEHHLVARTQRSITFARLTAGEPFSATADAIEFANWGPWIGFSPKALAEILTELQATGTGNGAAEGRSDLSVAGRRHMLPFFSNGFQGIVVGFFLGIDDITAELIRTEIMQYGQTLADKWSMLRRRHFAEALRESHDVERVAQALVQMVSPVDYVIVRSASQACGFRLRREHSYWAGYEKLDQEAISNLAQEKEDLRFHCGRDPDLEITIKTLSGLSMLDPLLTRVRLEMVLQHYATPQSAASAHNVPSLEMLGQMLEMLRERAASGHPSQATLRQLFVVDKMMRNFASGQMSVSNSEMKHFFETEIGEQRSMNGYQISSHMGDLERMFEGTVGIKKTRNSIKLKWRP
jgi:hypothetical protein